MSRAELIKLIKKLPEDQVEQVAQYMELLRLEREDPEYLAAMHEAIRRGQESARRGPLIPNDQVMAEARAVVRKAAARRKKKA